jgi:hypothetical protein
LKEVAVTIERVPATNLTYYLIAYDAEGKERTDDPDALMSQRVLEVLKNEPVTDVFLMSHGWQGDIPSARTQYSDWITAMALCPDDIERLQRKRPAFYPLLIGFHWPSLPWGDEDLGNAVSFSQPTEASTLDDVIDAYAERLADTPLARAALSTLFTTSLTTPAPLTLPENIRAAYAVLEQESRLEYNGVGAAPGADQDSFDPEWIFSVALQQSFGPGMWVTDALLAPLRTLSFWKMKERARRIGETAGFSLLQALQQAPTKGDSVRIHLMGHSFGCIVVSAALSGPSGRGALVRPVDAVMLVQGALSLWSYSAEIAPSPGQAGYFHSLMAQKKIAGPIITTQSTYDKAVGFFYPLGAGIMQQVSFAPGDFPTYGGIGSFGIQGPQLDIVDVPLLPLTGSYAFEPGKIYNLESSHVICQGDGPAGAHSDIAHPEVAHAFWQALCLSE